MMTAERQYFRPDLPGRLAPDHLLDYRDNKSLTRLMQRLGVEGSISPRGDDALACLWQAPHT